ncbi:MAG: nitroreductase family protein [Lactobacillaceae bacterium]|jgi:nitroreductase|nr:nitroreductase family protein [Lactobacillaceae bacterium]
MDLMEGLFTRRSVRKYDPDKTISKETLTEILKAAQYAPTAHNKQPWEFLVVDDKEVMAHLRSIQRWTSFAKDADKVVFVCGDVDQSFSRVKEDETWSFVDVDCALATQNLLLAAHAKGIGTCYCGCAPMQKVVDTLKEYLNLPKNVRPFAIVTMGYPAEVPPEPMGRYKEEKIHWGKW